MPRRSLMRSKVLDTLAVEQYFAARRARTMRLTVRSSVVFPEPLRPRMAVWFPLRPRARSCRAAAGLAQPQSRDRGIRWLRPWLSCSLFFSVKRKLNPEASARPALRIIFVAFNTTQGSFPSKIQPFLPRGSRHVFFSIFRKAVFFPSTQTAAVWRGWSADIPLPSDEYALRAG